MEARSEIRRRETDTRQRAGKVLAKGNWKRACWARFKKKGPDRQTPSFDEVLAGFEQFAQLAENTRAQPTTPWQKTTPSWPKKNFAKLCPDASYDELSQDPGKHAQRQPQNPAPASCPAAMAPQLTEF